MTPRAPGSPRRLRATAAFLMAGAAGATSRRLGMGAGRTLPGRIALLLAPGALSELARGREVALVSGTNGKTTTTRLLAAALSVRGPVVTNDDGANLLAGLTSALLAARRAPSATAVLEVDEVALPGALRQTAARTVLLLNLSRDQLDRNSEVASHMARWAGAFAASPDAMVVANADDPLVVAAILAARPQGKCVVWVAVGQPWRLDSAFCPRCSGPWAVQGHWRCPSCGLSRPTPHWSLAGPSLSGPDGRTCDLALALPGRANQANAAMAVAAACHLGVTAEDALERMRAVDQVDGRYQVVADGPRQVRLLLAKNPAGWLEALAELSGGSGPVVIGINARTPDGTDPSWLYDVPFELLRGRLVVASGERASDLAVRLRYAEVECSVEPDLLRALATVGSGRCELVANYSAFVTARTVLRRRAAAPVGAPR